MSHATKLIYLIVVSFYADTNISTNYLTGLYKNVVTINFANFKHLQ